MMGGCDDVVGWEGHREKVKREVVLILPHFHWCNSNSKRRDEDEGGS